MLDKMSAKLVTFWVIVHIMGSIKLISSQKNLVLIGGNLDDNNTEIYGKIIEMAGGVGQAKIGLTTAANKNAEKSGVFYKRMFLSHGAGEVYWIPVHEGNTDANSDAEVVSRIKEMTGFFFGGGEQLRVVTSYFLSNGNESPALIAIKEMYEGGAIVGGTSAGAACMVAPFMVVFGMSYEAVRNGAFELGTDEGPNDLTYYPQGGIGMLDGFMVDMHFGERGRQGRLMRLLSDTQTLAKGTQRGIGLDEDTALVVTNAGTPQSKGEVIGTKGVFFADISQSMADPDGWGIVNVKTHYLTGGDTIDMTSLEVTFASYKSNMAGMEKNDYAYKSSDIFQENWDRAEYTYAATELFNSRFSSIIWGDTKEQEPQYRVWFVKDSAAVAFGGTNPALNLFQIGYTNLPVHVEQTPSENSDTSSASAQYQFKYMEMGLLLVTFLWNII